MVKGASETEAAATAQHGGLAPARAVVRCLADKRRGRCWSPTRYADGATSRGNAGVASVSCLVFDCDRVPPDHERLEGVCWIGHTTWSHTPVAEHSKAARRGQGKSGQLR